VNLNIYIQNGELDTILVKNAGSYRIKFLLIITYLCTGLLPLFLFTSVVFRTTENYFIEERKKELLAQANIFSGHITLSGYLNNNDRKYAFDRDVAFTSEEGGYRILILDDMGVVVEDSNGTEDGKVILIPEVIEALASKDVAKEQENGEIYVAASIVNEKGEKVGAVLLVDNPKDIYALLDGIRKPVNLMTVVIAALVIAFVLVISHTITNPLLKLVKVIQKISDGHFDERMPVDEYGNSEVAQISAAINTMAEKLQEVESSRQQFVSNVSHELKTPLSSIKVLSESILLENDAPKEMYVEFLGDISSEVDRMTEIINDLLTLVRLDQREVPVDFKEESLNALIEQIVKRLKPIADSKKIEFEYTAVKDIKAEIDKTKLMLAISNLVENGIKYTDEGGKVSILLDSDHQNAFITVSDTGIGMAEDELGKIFDRFYRIDKARNRETGGTGLGLSITHSTVLMHNGSVKVNSAENIGTTFVVRIPLTHIHKEVL